MKRLFPCEEGNEDESQFDFAELVLGEIKKFTVLLFLSAMKFYQPCFSSSEMLEVDLPIFKDNLMDFVLKLIFAEGSSTLYKVCLSMCRFETIEDE